MIAETAAALRAGRLSARELAEERLARIDPALGAFITVTADLARRDADRADAALRRGVWLGPLHGIPVAVKDNIDVAGVPTTCGSAALCGEAEQDAEIVRRLRAGGAVILGKTAMNELAWGTDSRNGVTGPVGNPRHPGLHPGGSSGGSAAAVAAGVVFAALGTDTACSIRYPAHCCGIVGMKPDHALLPAAGVRPLVPTLDHPGGFGATVADTAALISACSGLRLAPPRAVAGLRLGVDPAQGSDCAPDIRAAFEAALAGLAAAGAQIVRVHLPPATETRALCDALFAEAAQTWPDPGRFGPETAAALRRVAMVPPGVLRRAQAQRAHFEARCQRALSGIDAFLGPAAGTWPGPADGSAPEPKDRAYLNATTFNLSRQPALSLPLGPGGPGMQVAARRGADAALLARAQGIEQALRAG